MVKQAEPDRPQLKLVVSNANPFERSSDATSVYVGMILETRRRRDAELAAKAQVSPFEKYETEGRRGHANPIVRAKAISAMVRDCRIAEKGGNALDWTFEDYLDDAYAECIALRSFERLVDLRDAERLR
ncbi:MAG: hypothetical protein ABW186_06645 [Rhodanobacteraceae bacterium]